MKNNFYIGLVHHPVIDKNNEIITTSVTNLDIHDISRTARTFGFSGFHIITPIVLQQNLVKKILGYWEGNVGSIYNPDRKSALSFSEVINSLEESISLIEKKHGKKPYIVVTGANFKDFSGDEDILNENLEREQRPLLLLFGTGWGLHESVLKLSDFKLAPIYGASHDGYNHLSVRSAVAIYCDRLQKKFKTRLELK